MSDDEFRWTARLPEFQFLLHRFAFLRRGVSTPDLVRCSAEDEERFLFEVFHALTLDSDEPLEIVRLRNVPPWPSGQPQRDIRVDRVGHWVEDEEDTANDERVVECVEGVAVITATVRRRRSRP